MAEFLQPRISVIIPVKNAQNFLGTCLNSVIIAMTEFKRHYKGINRFEIILVDNGSTDLSLKIAREYKVIKPLALKVVECQTPGAAAARNLGASVAKGEYLWFIDADDYISEDAVWKLYEATKGSVLTEEGAGFAPVIEVDADLVMMGAKRVYDDPKTAKNPAEISQNLANKDGKRDNLRAIPVDKNWKSRFIRYGMGPWQVLIRREWWLEHNFKFKEGIIHEDMELMPFLALFTDRFRSVDEPLYFYRQTPDSVLHKQGWDDRALDIFEALESLYSRFASVNAALTYKPELEWFFIWNLLLDSAKDFKKARHDRNITPEDRRAAKNGFKRSRKLLRKYFPHWRKNPSLREKSLKTRLRIRLNYWGICC